MSENKQTETTNHRSLYLALFVFLTLITNHLPLLFGTTVTGKLLDPQGNAITNGHARFLLMNYGIGNLPRVQGTFLIVNVTPIDVLAAADGTFSATIQGNDAITPLGTTYQVTLYAGGQVYLSANYSITGSTFDLNTATPASAVPAVPPAQAYTTVDSVGVPVTQRQILNFLGSGVTCADNSSVSRTDCTITGGGGGGATFQANGTNTSSQQTINWQSGTNITISNPSAGNVRFDFSGSLPIASGGTGQTTAGAAFNALSPMTTLGDVTYGGASGAGTRLGGNTTTTKQFL
ncbi:MAG: hypothetical protein DMG23_14080, partial [Acidobacteria bacterium]